MLARYWNSPLDYYRKNSSQVMGSATSGATGLKWFGTHRPFPGCGAPRTPFGKLYLSNSIWPIGVSNLGAGYVTASIVAEDLGLDRIQGARARHCRTFIDGSTALDTFLPLRWLLANSSEPREDALSSWRGELDWWVFSDGELGLAAVEVSGARIDTGFPVLGGSE